MLDESRMSVKRVDCDTQHLAWVTDSGDRVTRDEDRDVQCNLAVVRLKLSYSFCGQSVALQSCMLHPDCMASTSHKADGLLRPVRGIIRGRCCQHYTNNDPHSQR